MSIISIGNRTLTWDEQSLSLNLGGIKRSLYLTAGAPKGLLYRSRAVPTSPLDIVGRLRGLREYRVTADTSTLALMVAKTRDFIADIIHVLFGSHVGKFNKAIHAIVLVLVATAGSPFACASLVAQLYVVQAFRLQQCPSRTQSYPMDAAIRHVAVGALTWVPMVATLTALEPIMDILLQMLYPVQDPTLPPAEQDIVTFIKTPGIGTFFSLYASVGAPLLEEYVFRGSLRDFFTEQETAKAGIVTRLRNLMRLPPKQPSVLHPSSLRVILKTSIVFGLCHYSASQGPLNIPIVIVTTLIGIVCAILREQTGNLWASTALHATHNTFCTLQLYNLIPQISFR